MIAVIGSGASLRGSGLGKQIDAFDAVVRVNWYAIAGHEKDVGTKTSHWAVAAVSSGLAKEFAHYGLPVDAIEAAEIWMIAHEPRHPKAHGIVAQFRGMARKAKGRFDAFGLSNFGPTILPDMQEAGCYCKSIGPSTGLQALAIALTKWAERPIRIAGFAGVGHYWDRIKPMGGWPACHDVKAEHRLIDKWVERGDVARMDA